MKWPVFIGNTSRPTRVKVTPTTRSIGLANRSIDSLISFWPIGRPGQPTDRFSLKQLADRSVWPTDRSVLLIPFGRSISLAPRSIGLVLPSSHSIGLTPDRVVFPRSLPGLTFRLIRFDLGPLGTVLRSLSSILIFSFS